MRWADYTIASGLSEAFSALASDPECRVLAGGTDIVVQLEKKPQLAESVSIVDVARIPELHGISLDGGRLIVGAAVTMSELAASDSVWKHATALAEGAAAAASPLIRNVATVGGNVVNASPAADSAPGLIVAGATGRLVTAAGSREVPVEEIQVGPGACILQKGELLLDLSIPVLEDGEGQAFMKLGRRKALSISLVNAAARITVEGQVIKGASAVLGAVAPRFVVLRQELTDLLAGRAWNETAQRDVASLIESSVSPISDLRAGADYRRKMAGVLAVRALDLAYQRARGLEAAAPVAVSR